MKRLALLLMLALAFPVAAQQKKAKKPAGKPPAHSKPTPQQIRKFNELEKKEEKQPGGIRGRSPNSSAPPSQKVRAPSPK